MKDNIRLMLVDEIKILIASGKFYEYKDLLRYLHHGKKFNLKGHMISNRYLYGALVREAKSI